MKNVTTHRPEKQGLYNPANEHDACGIGFVANIKGKKNHSIVQNGLEMLENLEHRGAVGSDKTVGDGAGMLTNLPDKLFRDELKKISKDLPKEGHYGVGMIFLPTSKKEQDKSRKVISKFLEENKLQLFHVRDVPVKSSILSVEMKKSEPAIKQFFVKIKGKSNSSILEKKHKISNDFEKANFPMIIIGDEVLQNDCSLDVQKVSTSILKKFGGFNKNWNGFNILHNYASTVGAIDILSEYSDYNYSAFKNDINKNLIKFVYLLNADDFDFDISSCFVIYQGHHGDKGAQLADVILPGAAYTEKEGSYTNLEGRVQYSQRATFPPGDAKEDWTILRALSEKLGKKLDFDNLLQLRDIMFSSKTMLKFDENIYSSEPKIITKSDFKSSKLNYENKNFFMTCPISRCSSTMAECSQVNG